MDRFGLAVPRGWWASAPLLKSYEAAGFGLVQVESPPASVLCDAAHCARHAAALAESLATTTLRAVVHAPAELRAGAREGDRAFDGLLSYAAEAGAEWVVYHAYALPNDPHSEDAFLFEARSLATLAQRAERLGITIAIENLAPVYPGPETLSANPMSLRGLAHRIGSDAVGICLDLGHAHITADLSHTWVELLVEPVLDVVTLFHVHDNLGARRRPTGGELGVDPLRLDLHLPPGRGTLPWERIRGHLTAHGAPLVLEVHPPYRPRTQELRRGAIALLADRAAESEERAAATAR